MKIAYLMKSKRAFENHSAITQSDPFRFRICLKWHEKTTVNGRYHVGRSGSNMHIEVIDYF